MSVFRSLLNLRVPVVVAPMAGISNPSFVINSSQAGALGSFGFAYTAPEKIASDIREVQRRHHCSRLPLNANFFIFPPIDESSLNSSQLALSLETLRSHLPEEYAQAVTTPQAPYFPDLDTQLEAIWETKPSCLSFHFGIPPVRVVERAKALGIVVGMSATSLQEAEQVARAGADYVVLQGIEAGGHRGTFTPNDASDEQLSSLQLLTRVRAHLRFSHPTLEIVVSGGMMTKAAVREPLSLGASAVQMGTIFIPSRESSASLEYKNSLLGSPSASVSSFFPPTAYTTLWSGRRAQCLHSTFLNHLTALKLGSPEPYDPLPFPLQNTVTQRVREIAKSRKDSQFQSLYAGSNYTQCCEVLYGCGGGGWKTEDELLTIKEIIHKIY